jgi:hypothetical protein
VLVLIEVYHHDMPTSRDSLEATLPRRPLLKKKIMKAKIKGRNRFLNVKAKFNKLSDGYQNKAINQG